MYPSPRAVFAAAIIWLGFAAAAVAAEPNAPAGATAPNPPAASARQSYGGAVQIPANGRPIALEVGKGTLIRLPRPANTVFVANPDIADVQIKSPTLVYVSAKAPGQTVIYAVDGNDAVLLNAAVRVDFDLSQLHQSLERLAPGNAISVTQVDSSLVLSGAVATAGQAEKIRTLAAAVTGGVKGSEVINRLSVATPNQVNLRVRIAEVDRNILKQIGLDWSKLGTASQFQYEQWHRGPIIVEQRNTRDKFCNFRDIPRLSGNQVAATLEALATEGFLTVLAEPNLTAMSGQTASFLAGGEFPYPVPQSSSAGAGTTITIEFKTIWRTAGVHPDDHGCRPSQSEGPARGQPAETTQDAVHARRHLRSRP